MRVFFSSYFFILSLPFFLSFYSCGKNKEEKINDSIEKAKNFLTQKQCQEAIDTLNQVGAQNKNAKYLQTLASAFACKADYSTIVFYGTDLPLVDKTLSGFFGSLTTFSTSFMSDPSDEKFLNLLSAINTLLYAGGISMPSSSNRLEVFTQTEINDMNIQTLFMILTALGKYIFYYGNADPIEGTKGTGLTSNGNTNNLSNTCFYLYAPQSVTLAATITAAKAAGTLGSCITASTGHEKLVALPNASTVKRMCQGIVLFNNMIDIITSTTLPSTTLGNVLLDVGLVIKTACTSIPNSGSICNIKSQAVCEADFSTLPQTDYLELYFFYIFESLFL